MRCMAFALCIVFLSAAWCLRAGVAQEPEGRPTVRGLFGDRTLGQPLQPGPSRFGSGLQRGPSGNFLGLGRPDGSSMFFTPWRRVEPGPLPVDFGMPPPAVQVTVPPPVVMQPPQPEPQQPPAEQPLVQPPEQQAPDMWFRSSTPPAAAGGSAEAGGAGWYGPGWSYGPGVTGRSGGAVARTSSVPQPAPALSARIMRLARNGGVQAPSGIEVSLQGDTAIVRGVVATPYQRGLVGNLVRMEPGVWQVDNQLIVAPDAAAAAAAR